MLDTYTDALFATGRCSRCGRQTLSYERLLDNGGIESACMTCDTAMIPTDYCTLDEIGGLGFALIEDAPPKRSCSSGGCGSGRGCSSKSKGGGCGSGGCGSGGCGVI